jgi:hypothetical protein
MHDLVPSCFDDAIGMHIEKLFYSSADQRFGGEQAAGLVMLVRSHADTCQLVCAGRKSVPQLGDGAPYGSKADQPYPHHSP